MGVRVLHIINTLGRGGAERQLVNLIAATQTLPIRHSVVTLAPPHSLVPELRAMGVTVTNLPPQPFQSAWKQVSQLVWLIRTWKPTVVHTWLRRSHLLGRVAAWKASTPIISSLQSPVYWPESLRTTIKTNNMTDIVGKHLEQITSHISKTVFVGCSEHVTTLHQQALGYPQQRMHTIYNSIALPTQSAMPHYPAQRLITVGRLIPEKGQCFLIDAMPAVLARYPAVHLTIVGGGPLHEQLKQQIARLDIGHAITITGTHSDVPAMLRQADLFIFPSISEGLPLALLEAMGHRLPCIASTIPAAREILGTDAGVGVPPGNVAALSAAIMRLIANPEECQILQEAGYRRITTHFDIAITKQHWLALYQQLSTSRSHP